MNKVLTPSEKYNLPVIGKIQAKLSLQDSKGKSIDFPVDEYEVIKIIDNSDGSKVYLCNQWNSPNVAQLIPSMFVISFEEK